MKQYTLCLFTLIILICSSCGKDTGASLDVRPNAEKEELDVSYGSHPYQKMDVYFPTGYTLGTPVVFLIHGGGFLAGLKEDFTSQSKLFRDRGYVIVNLSHRLVDTTGLLQTPPAHMQSEIRAVDEIEDVKTAVAKYRAMASSWGTGTSRMYMAGHSAGAILAMLYTQGPDNDTTQIRACANWAGVTDLSIPHDSLLDDLDPRYIEALYRITGFMPSTANNLAYMAISPYWVANNRQSTPLPTISIFPAENNLLNIPDEVAFNLARTQSYHQLLKNKGVAEKLSIYEGETHGFSTYADSWAKLIEETANFFEQN
jgi:acetyl esterase/lipase